MYILTFLIHKKTTEKDPSCSSLECACSVKRYRIQPCDEKGFHMYNVHIYLPLKSKLKPVRCNQLTT